VLQTSIKEGRKGDIIRKRKTKEKEEFFIADPTSLPSHWDIEKVK
jgi:hypothetical protein